MWAPNEVYMASIHIRSDSREIRKYYGSIDHNNLHICKNLGLIKKQYGIIYTERESGE